MIAAQAVEALTPIDVGPQHADRGKTPEQHRQAAGRGRRLAPMDATSRLASTATAKIGIRIAIAVVDHGRNTAMATTSQSAIRPSAIDR